MEEEWASGAGARVVLKTVDMLRPRVLLPDFELVTGVLCVNFDIDVAGGTKFWKMRKGGFAWEIGGCPAAPPESLESRCVRPRFAEGCAEQGRGEAGLLIMQRAWQIVGQGGTAVVLYDGGAGQQAWCGGRVA